MLHLKICGMKFPGNILEVSLLEPTYMGFIFHETSPRHFSGPIPEFPAAIKKTGVFVNSPLDFIRAKIKEFQLQAVQLHGEEPPELCMALKTQNIAVIKVFSVKDHFNFQLLQPYEGKVGYFLFDTKGKARGGNGETFNWELLKQYPSATPFILSGGIGLEEVENILSLWNFFRKNNKEFLFHGIDVNSRFEMEPGLKNLQDLRKFKIALEERINKIN